MTKRKTDLPASRHIEANPYVALGVAVIRRAIQDLTISGIRNAKRTREDSLDFLTRRLWGPNSLWGELLNGIITQQSIFMSVQKRLFLDKNGKAINLRKK